MSILGLASVKVCLTVFVCTDFPTWFWCVLTAQTCWSTYGELAEDWTAIGVFSGFSCFFPTLEGAARRELGQCPSLLLTAVLINSRQWQCLPEELARSEHVPCSSPADLWQPACFPVGCVGSTTSHPVVSNFPAFQVSRYHLPQLFSHLTVLQSPSFCLLSCRNLWMVHPSLIPYADTVSFVFLIS